MVATISDRPLIPVTIKNGKALTFQFLENSALFALTHKHIMINQVLGSPLEVNLNNIYLRVWTPDGIKATPMLSGRNQVASNRETIVWQGKFLDVEYSCQLRLVQDDLVWLWQVSLNCSGRQTLTTDLILVQDLGLADQQSLRLNEAYTSQYIDHTVLRHPTHGYVINSRQNQGQPNCCPAVMHGCLDKTVGFATDGIQFYGTHYKATNEPDLLTQPCLPNEIMQSELALPQLQTRTFKLSPNQKKTTGFFGFFNPHQAKATGNRELVKFEKLVKKVKSRLQQPIAPRNLRCWQPSRSFFETSSYYLAHDFSRKELDVFFKGPKRHLEKRNGKLLSFFYSDHSHVVLKEKEIWSERPHGHIIRSGQDVLPNEEILTTTSYMNGVFNAQLTVGNTSFNKMLSVVRHPLNALKSSGQRIFVKTENGYELLGLPSAYELGLNYVRWIYRGKKETINVKVWADSNQSTCFLSLEVTGPRSLEFLITNQLVIGNHEWEKIGPIKVDEKQQHVICQPATGSLMQQHYPKSGFEIYPLEKNKISEIGFNDLIANESSTALYPYLVFRSKATKRITLVMSGFLHKKRKILTSYDHLKQKGKTYTQAIKQGEDFWQRLNQSAQLVGKRDQEDLNRLEDIIAWYTHNAMIHYTAPHGLEQYSGAAWGLRDVCQGPVELLRCMGQLKSLKRLIKMIYRHQYLQTGDWPQWFMFDRYHRIQSQDSHGDIIIWPIKAVCDYIETTNDLTILKSPICYTNQSTKTFTTKQSTLLEHIRKQIKAIQKNCIPGTALISYGHGDWEDTLQPADPGMRRKMVSSWTVELLYQSLRRLIFVLEKAQQQRWAEQLKNFAQAILKDFNQYLIKDRVAAGLVYFHGPKKIEYILHPRDKRTGIHYRLLPMTRGIISELFSPEQMAHHHQLINKKLLFPDGVRLMEQPIAYLGGIEKNFKRAETASNFGREISLQYVHAHIRYIEALAKIGQADELYQALLTINPIMIQRSLPTATVRQSNCYFSSSDAAFLDRYQAKKQFWKIKKKSSGDKRGLAYLFQRARYLFKPNDFQFFGLARLL